MLRLLTATNQTEADTRDAEGTRKNDSHAIVPERWHWIIRFNPVRSILEVFRDPIYYGKIPPLPHLAVTLVIALVALGIGALAFRKSGDRIPFYV